VASDLTLTIDLVPGPLWGTSLYRLVKRSAWERTRKAAREASQNRCAICGAGGTLTCHETWGYDDTARVATLTGTQAICRMCNFVKHWG
jgi:hypothetical protein